MPRDYTYSTVDSYVTDILRIHDNRLRHQPNAINDEGDYIYKTSTLAAMRTVFPSFFKPELRRGPFTFMLTDLHQSNIFVDQNWHLSSLVDLEWTCTRPIEMLRTPTWLTNKAVDEIADEAQEYDLMRREFVDILATEEQTLGSIVSGSNQQQLSTILKDNWAMGDVLVCTCTCQPDRSFCSILRANPAQIS